MTVQSTIGITENERAYDRLRRAILHGDELPGAKLKIDNLKQHYDTGTSPLREALARLVSEGLVTFQQNRGFRVAEISVEDLQGISHIRKLLEAESLADSIRSGNDEWEGRVVSAYHRLASVERKFKGREASLAEVEERNRDFHNALVSAASSQRLMDLRYTMYELHERYRRLSRLETNDDRCVEEEHRSIMQAALDRDAESAKRLNDIHIDLTTNNIIRVLTVGNVLAA